MSEGLDQARRAALGDRSPRARGREKDAEALHWVYRWGWSTPVVTDSFASPNRRGVARRLVGRGLLKEMRTWRSDQWTPRSILMLTPAGEQAVEDNLDEQERINYRRPRRVPGNLQHDVMAQTLTVRALNDPESPITDYLTPREMKGHAPGKKAPDVIHLDDEGWRLFVEVELTGKHGPRLHEFMGHLLEALESINGPDAVAIRSPSRRLLERYRDALKTGSSLQGWRRDERRRQVRKKHLDRLVPDWALSRIHLKEIAP